jgi:hypothetical protein
MIIMCSIHKIDVWYDNQFKTWAVTIFDTYGNQIGECEYSYRKVSAILEASAIKSERGGEIHVHNKIGKLMKII